MKDFEFSTRIKDKICDVKRQYALPPYNLNNISQIPSSELELSINDQLFLEVLLMEIRGETIKYASEKNKRNKCRQNSLEKDIQNLEKELARSNDRDILENIETKKLELEEMRRVKMEGVMMRSKARWVEHGEKPSKYFVNLEKRNYVNKAIVHLENANGETLKKQDQILQETLNCYSIRNYMNARIMI